MKVSTARLLCTEVLMNFCEEPARERTRKSHSEATSGCETCKSVKGLCCSFDRMTNMMFLLPSRAYRVKCDGGKPTCVRCTESSRVRGEYPHNSHIQEQIAIQASSAETFFGSNVPAFYLGFDTVLPAGQSVLLEWLQEEERYLAARLNEN